MRRPPIAPSRPPTARRSLGAVLASLAAVLGAALGLGCEPRGRGPAGGRADAPAPSVVGARSGSSTGSDAAAAPSGRPSATGSPSASTSTAAPVPAAPPRPALATGGKGVARGEHGMVSSEDVLASRVGAEILAAGGNAVDAAVAMGYVLAVTHHVAGSLGGGGFMVVRLAQGASYAVDFRETAPAGATAALNEQQLARGAHGYRSAPVPGVVAGLELARGRFGTLPRERLLAPAIALAEQGHPYSRRQAEVLAWHFARLHDPVLRAVLGRGRGHGKPIGAGDLLAQPRLADTLRAIAAQGEAGFYRGEVARRIAAAMKQHGGLVTEQDLAGYHAVVREPLRLDYRGYEVLTMPPPSMGGIALVSILQNLARVEPPPAHGSAASLHLFVESARRAYADRRSVGADPDQVDRAVVAPLLARLLDPGYHASRQPPIDPARATPSSKIVPIAPLPPGAAESPETTHYSVVDAQGNVVACTTTLSAAFGAWVMVPETGVILSNAMGAFSPRGANVLAPGKRMASSMTPALLVQGGRTVAVLGSPGGDTIPGTVAQLVRNLVDDHLTLDQAIEAGRIHHQYLPDVVRLEKKRLPPAEVRAALARLGHRLEPSPLPLGDANCVLVDPVTSVAYGFADTRKGGLALGPSSAAPPPAPAASTRPP
jgi:gamma-glutamyltranspeptidase/glutathione hydrolase